MYTHYSLKDLKAIKMYKSVSELKCDEHYGIETRLTKRSGKFSAFMKRLDMIISVLLLLVIFCWGAGTINRFNGELKGFNITQLQGRV